MTWIIPENKLDAQQRDFLDNVDITRKNVWIKGFAGSGKSVLLVYTAKKILSRNSSSSVILVVFTQALVEMFKAAFQELGLRVEIETYYKFMKDGRAYDYILVDEVQDLTPRIISEMNRLASHIVVAGDSNQSIYESDPRWREVTVSPSEVGRLINGDPFELGIIHRLSRSIIDAVQRFLPRMSIFSSKRDMTKVDTQIRLCEATSEAKEVSYIMEQATKAVNQGYSTAILIPTQKKIIDFVNQALCDVDKSPWVEQTNQYGKIDFGAMNNYLKANGVKIQYVGNGYGKFSENDHRIVIMTFHSSKGLDFDNVFIPYANSSMFISSNESLAKTLFMVAMTRTKENLYITYYGYPSDYLDTFKSNCSKIDISSITNNKQTATAGNPWGF
ncbi:3'-5' exonuclease [Bacteroides hominis]|uniref:3'-5' exonuclease n=1 Tax=Bacteroides hominis TaxID=2763023 RepID=UPI0029491ACD|nr:3'-5' exonuclease [Bacteroides hominis (ex Liu et al. 2022)]MDV6135850.1 3'-5' exonuclease [Bacteroides hominis (ex Liu et al. 2022)]MDV6153046.1 3'-5' exonuclease [Bacteroides hominis (ex Liu et al. 2022)]